MKIVKLTHWDRKKAENFANARCEDNADLYKKRGNFKREDIVIGALAELGVYKLLHRNNILVEKPDFSIHEVKRKSFSPDLSNGKLHFHVKGQSTSSAAKYGTSWLMQKTDPIINNPEKCHYLVPTLVDTETNEVKIFGVFSISSIVDNDCLGVPKIDWIARTKIAIYNDYLEAVLTPNARWGLLYRQR